MKFLRILYSLFLLIIIILSVTFSVSNSQNVQIYYYFDNINIPLSLALGISLCIGCLLGLAVSLKSIITAKYRLRSLNHEIALANKEISNLRSIPIKDEH